MWLLADMQIEAEGVLEADMQIPYFMRGEQICKLGQGVCCRGSRGKTKGEFILKIGLCNVRRRGW